MYWLQDPTKSSDTSDVRFGSEPAYTQYESEDKEMANKTLFASLRDALIPQTDTVNSENAPAYALAPKQALAQYAATGCFGASA